MARPQAHDDASDFFRIVERLPFVGTAAREIQELRALLYERRAARLCALGASGAGKTSLANALLGEDVLPLGASDAPHPTREASDGGALLAHGSWTDVSARGRRLAWLEVPSDEGAFSREVARRLENALEEHTPDVVLATLRADRLDDELPALTASLARLGDLLRKLDATLPHVVVVLTAADELVKPAEFARPPYPNDALLRIDEAIERARRAIEGARVLSPSDKLARPIAHAHASDPSGRYQLEALAEAIFEQLPDAARVEAARAMPVSDASVRAIARKLTLHFSSIAVVVGLMPIPFSDAVALVPTQALMVTSVAYVAGQPWDRRAALEWLGSLGVMGGTAIGLRWGAQQLLKLWPGGGTLISASVAGVGTQALGASAIAYFIDGPGRRGRLEPTALAGAE